MGRFNVYATLFPFRKGCQNASRSSSTHIMMSLTMTNRKKYSIVYPFRLCRMLRIEAFKKTPCRKATQLHSGTDGTDAALRPMHDALTYASFTPAHSASVTCTDTGSGFLKSVKLSLRVAFYYKGVAISLSTVGSFTPSSTFRIASSVTYRLSYASILRLCRNPASPG